MAERLVGIFLGVRRRRIRSVVAVRAIGSRRAVGTKGFVGVRGLLGRDAGRTCVTLRFVVRRTTGAAARADDPEEGSGQGEGSCQPCGCEDVLAHATSDTVFFEFFIQ